jgi:catalase
MASRKQAGTDRQAVEYGDQRVERGQGGETHQVASGDAPRLTTQQGIVVSDDQNTLRAGERGPSTLEDFHFREKIFHFDHERIPERVVHARGYGAHGYFENYEPLTEITRADPFSEADDGFVSLDEHSAADFISRCARLRFWPRQASIAHRAGTATASAGQG